MSVINQMLRDLDARTAQGDVPTPRPAVESRALKWPTAGVGLVLGLLLVVAAGIYWLLPGWDGRHTPPIMAGTGPQQTVATVGTSEFTPVVKTPESAATLPEVSPDPIVSRMAASVDTPKRPVAAAQRPPRPTAPPLPGMALALEARLPRQGPADGVVQIEPSAAAHAQRLFEEAQAHQQARDLEAAAAKYRQALERDPGLTQARIQLARLLQELGQADVGLSLLKTGHEQRSDALLAITAGRMLADMGQREEAIAWLARAQEGLRPADHALMGMLLSQAQRHEEAILAYRRAIASNPDHGGWLLGLGLALEAHGQIEQARTLYRRALERGQFKPEVVLFLRERSGLPPP